METEKVVGIDEMDYGEIPAPQKELVDFDLTKPMTKNIVGGFLDKKSKVGKTEVFRICGVTKIPHAFNTGKQKLVLQLQDTTKTNVLLDVNSENLNDLIDRISPIPNDWVGKTIQIRFESFESMGRDGRQIKGVTWKIL